MRIPISRVWRVTLYDISPYSPIEASNSARPPKKLASVAVIAPALGGFWFFARFIMVVQRPKLESKD